VAGSRPSSALDREQDPTASLAAASAALGEALKRNPEDAQAHFYLGETLGVRARWEAGRGSFRAADFERAAEAYQKAMRVAPNHHDYAIAFAHFCRAWAAAARAAGKDGSAPLAKGLTELERVFRARPALPDALVARGRLRFAQAEAADTKEERRALADGAREDFSQGLVGNPNLERRYRAEASLAQR
jgi:tetratricopeptide (TPR) repeat protein